MIKLHWWCRIFGHTFYDFFDIWAINPKFRCRKCGITREEIEEEEIRNEDLKSMGE